MLNRYYRNDIAKYCDYFTHEDSSVLELGCKNVDLLSKLKAKRKVGVIDNNNLLTELSSKGSNIDFVLGNLDSFTLNEKFDLIVISNQVGLLKDVQKVFEQLHKVCHENTKVVVVYYNYLWEPIIRLAELIGIKQRTPMQNWLTLADVNNLLYLSGFDVYRNAKRLIIPIYIPIVSEIFNVVLAKLPVFQFFCLNFFTFAKQSPRISKSDYDSKYSVSVVIPARNESGNIENAITRLPKFGKHTEIIFIEGNSTDDTWDKIQEIQKKYSVTHDIKIGRQKGKGKADAVREGFKLATCDLLMILDADLTMPPEDLPKFYDAIASGKGDFVNGCRLVYPMEDEAMRFLNLLGNRFFSLAFTWLLGQKFKDTLCGTKVLFREDYYKLVKNQSYFGDFDPFGDFDLIFGAHKLNLKIVEIPIRYRERTYGSTNISRFKHGFILLQMCAFAMRKIKFI